MLEYVGVPLLFALCGAASARICFSDFPEVSFIFPVPFALLSSMIFLRKSRTKPFKLIFLIVVVWYVSFCSAYTEGFMLPVVLPGMIGVVLFALPGALGGLIGGGGLTLCARIAFPRLASTRYYVLGAVIGTCSGLAFLPWVRQFVTNLDHGPTRPPVRAFAIWEGVMATYLYAICCRPSDDLKRIAQNS